MFWKLKCTKLHNSCGLCNEILEKVKINKSRAHFWEALAEAFIDVCLCYFYYKNTVKIGKLILGDYEIKYLVEDLE